MIVIAGWRENEVQMVVPLFETSITSSNHQRNEDNTQLHH